jgi:hypothetical protein
VGVEEVIRQMELRHQKRQASIDSAYAKQKLDLAARMLGM